MNNALYLSRQSETAIPISAGLTWRAVALGIGLAVPSTVWTIHASYVASSSQISVTHLPVAEGFEDYNRTPAPAGVFLGWGGIAPERRGSSRMFMDGRIKLLAGGLSGGPGVLGLEATIGMTWRF